MWSVAVRKKPESVSTSSVADADRASVDLYRDHSLFAGSRQVKNNNAVGARIDLLSGG